MTDYRITTDGEKHRLEEYVSDGGPNGGYEWVSHYDWRHADTLSKAKELLARIKNPPVWRSISS